MRKKVIVIRLSSLGDVVLSTSVIEILEKKFDVFFATKKYYQHILKNDPRIKGILTAEDSSLKELIKLARKIKEMKPDAILDLHDKISTKLLRLMVDPFQKITFVWDSQRIERNKALLKKDFRNVRPVIVRFSEIASKLAGENPSQNHALPKIFPPPHPKSQKLKKFIQESQERRKNIICVAPESRWKTKMWNLTECDKLINSLEKSNFSVAVVGTKKEIEKYFSGGEKFFGELDIEDIVYLISKSHTVVSVDSGIAHIAYALQKRLIVIFTSTKPEMGFFTRDYGKFVEYGNLRCRPCSLIGKDHCPQRHHLCSLIHYQKVEREIKNA